MFLDDHQNETLIILSDLIIPATDSPGAKEALANRFIDLVLAAETHDRQRAFLDSLGYLDGESMRRYKAAFRYLKRDEQDDSRAPIPAGSGWTGEAAAPTSATLISKAQAAHRWRLLQFASRPTSPAGTALFPRPLSGL
jgi:hypothetical protein